MSLSRGGEKVYAECRGGWCGPEGKKWEEGRGIYFRGELVGAYTNYVGG